MAHPYPVFELFIPTNKTPSAPASVVNHQDAVQQVPHVLHHKMLHLYKNYHTVAKKNPSYSLRDTLHIFQKLIQTDSWLNEIVSEELDLLTKNAVKNPYWENSISI